MEKYEKYLLETTFYLELCNNLSKSNDFLAGYVSQKYWLNRTNSADPDQTAP